MKTKFTTHHTGNAYRSIRNLVHSGNRKFKKEESLGCCYCGARLSGKEVLYIRDDEHTNAWTAACPICGMSAIVSNSESTPITKENLALWNRLLFSFEPPLCWCREMSEISL